MTWVNAHSLNRRHNGSFEPATAGSGCPHECSACARPCLDVSVHVRTPVGDLRSTARRNRIRCVGVRARSGRSTSRLSVPPAERNAGRCALAAGSHARPTACSGSWRSCGDRRAVVGAVGTGSSAGSTARASSAATPNQSAVDATTTTASSAGAQRHSVIGSRNSAGAVWRRRSQSTSMTSHAESF